VYDEVNGHKGCCEIATCILKYLRSLPDAIHTVNTWSDTCAAQNRNHILLAALIFAVNSIPHLQQVNTKFLESGHTYLECDSMHSRIEARKKDRKIYTPDQIVPIIEDARCDPRPYRAEQLIFSDFFDMKELAKRTVKNYTIDSESAPVRWLQIKWMQINEKSDVVRFKYDYEGDFHEFNFRQKPLKRPRRCTAMTTAEIGLLQLQKVHSARLPISMAKKNDLLSLIRDGVIRPAYEAFYANLPADPKIKDTTDVIEVFDEDDPELLGLYNKIVEAH